MLGEKFIYFFKGLRSTGTEASDHPGTIIFRYKFLKIQIFPIKSPKLNHLFNKLIFLFLFIFIALFILFDFAVLWIFFWRIFSGEFSAHTHLENCPHPQHAISCHCHRWTDMCHSYGITQSPFDQTYSLRDWIQGHNWIGRYRS